MKKLMRLTENDLHRIVNESVSRMLNEDSMPSDEEGIGKSFEKQDYLLTSKVAKILKQIYNVGMELGNEYIMDLCIEAQRELLREKGF